MQCAGKRRFDKALAGVLVLTSAGGMCAGWFLSRLLAEETLASWAWQPLPIAGVVTLTTLLPAAAAGALYRRRQLRGAAGADMLQRLIAPALAFLLPAIYLSQGSVNPLQARVLLVGTVAAAALVATADAPVAAETPARRRAGRLVALALLCLPFLVYLLTLSPSLGEADSFEFQVTASRLGVAHPTGYPLYILLGRLFIFLPVGDVAYRVNLVSPVFAALAVALVYLLVVRLTGRRAAALIAALCFAWSRTLWSQAVIAEVYVLNAFFVALMLYLLLASDQAPVPPRRGWLPFLYGLSLTNHLTMILLAPALAVALLWPALGLASLSRRPEAPAVRPLVLSTVPSLARRGKRLLATAGLFLLGVSAYLYIPLRWPALHHGRAMALREFLAWVTGRRFGGALRLDAWLHDPVRYGILGRLVLEQYGWAGIVVAAGGLAWLLWKQRRVGVCLLLAWAAYAFYGLNYIVSDIAVFLIPAHLVLAICIGVALAVVGDWLRCRARLLPPVVMLLVALLPLSLVWTNWPLVDRSQAGREALRWGRRVLALDIPGRAAILADSEKIAPLYYLQTVEGLRPDLDVVVMGDEAGYRQQLEERIAAGQPVYLARFLPGLEARFRLCSLGPLVEVGTVAQTVPPTIDFPVGASFGDSIRLLGFNASSLSVERGDVLPLSLFWRADSAVPGHFQVRLRLLGASGHVWWEGNAHPVAGLYPTGAWVAGQVVSDYHEVPAGSALPPGDYRLQVGLFPPFAARGLSVNGAAADLLPLADIHVAQSTHGPPLSLAIGQPRRASFGGLMLVGSDHPAVARPGSRLALTLYWRPLSRCPDYRVAVEALNEAGQVVAAVSGPPMYGEYPTSHWPVGQVVRTDHVLLAPPTAGPLQLRVGLRDPSTGQLVPGRPRWLSARSAWCPLGTVAVQGTPLAGEGVANFGDHIYLLGHKLDRQTLRPGDTLDLALTWQCAKRMGEDYTVFVHFLDRADRVRGQVDAWPVQGTYPTSQWTEGETILDVYRVRLDPDAPPGPYRIEVGWYLLSTMERLPVLDEQMRPVESRVLMGGLEVAGSD